MSTTRDGGCQCGTVRYRIEGTPLDLAVCHCTECQRQSGSAFGMSLAIRAADFHVVSGVLKSFTVLCDSGRTKTCTFCPDFGTRIYHQTDSRRMSVKAGTLDDRTDLRPDAHYWTTRKQAWVIIPDGVTAVPDDG